MRWERDFQGCLKESLWSRQNCCVEVYSCADLRPGAGQRDLLKDNQFQTMLFKGENQNDMEGGVEKCGRRGIKERVAPFLRGRVTLSKKVAL